MKRFIVKVYDPYDPYDEGRIIASCDNVEDAIAVEKEENTRNLASNSCEIAVMFETC